MIQLALRSSIQAEPPVGSARSARIDGSATAVTSSSSPARNTPSPDDGEQHQPGASGHVRECIEVRRRQRSAQAPAEGGQRDQEESDARDGDDPSRVSAAHLVDHQGGQGCHPQRVRETLGEHQQHQRPRGTQAVEPVAEPEAAECRRVGRRDGHRRHRVPASGQAASFARGELHRAGKRQDAGRDQPRPLGQPGRGIDDVMEHIVAEEGEETERRPRRPRKPRGTRGAPHDGALPATVLSPPRPHRSRGDSRAPSSPRPSPSSRRGTPPWRSGAVARPRSARGGGGCPRHRSGRR